MNDLGIALIWLTMQVTAVALAGIGLTAFAARRTPGAGASTARTALAATAVLAMLAGCPLPSWWAWELTTAPAVDAAGADRAAEEGGSAAAQPDQTAESSPPGGMRLTALIAALQNLTQGSAYGASEVDSSWRWPAVVAAIVGMGTALGLLQLLLGLWAIRQGWHRSRSLEEPELHGLVEELRSALGVKRPVAVRASADLTTAATVGWRRPVLLLPPDWRGWTAEQRRAVVAHELAHIRRDDFAAWALARLSVALHFWHPLVRALAGQLHLQQELAADAAAALLAGGRSAYLRALAELALRSDGRPRRWPAPAFLSRKGTLLRRIEMLRVTEDGLKRDPSRTGRRFTLVALFVLTLGASALRTPVGGALAGPPAGAATPPSVAPFNLSLLGRNDDNETGGIQVDGPLAMRADDKLLGGVYAVRPAAILNRPGMGPVRQLINTQIDVFAQALKVGELGIHVEDVEQIMGRVYSGGENKTGKRAAMLSLTMLRTTKDMDWAKLRDQFGPNMKEHQWKGETYVSLPLPEFLMSIMGVNGDCFFWAPDARTLVWDSDTAIKAQIEARTGGPKLLSRVSAADWDLVSTGLLALALDNPGQQLSSRTLTDAEIKKALADPTKPEYHALRFYQNVSRAVVGLAGSDDFRFDLRASAETPEAAAEMVRNCETLLAIAKATAELKKSTATPSDKAEATALDFCRRALERVTIRRDGAVVTVHAEVASGLNALLALYGKELAQGKQ